MKNLKIKLKTCTVEFYNVFCPTFGLYHDELLWIKLFMVNSIFINNKNGELWYNN